MTHAFLAAEAGRLRRDVHRRYTEADLLAAALRDHVADLQAERDHLRGEVTRLRGLLRRESAAWFVRGQRPQR